MSLKHGSSHTAAAATATPVPELASEPASPEPAPKASTEPTVADYYGDDPYEALGLGHLRSAATDADIKRAYRLLSLEYHPDKVQQRQIQSEPGTPIAGSPRGDRAPKSLDERFKLIQAAYETLSDAGKRRAYDSTDDVVDTVPSEAQAARCSRSGVEDFLALYRPVFARNARWSTDKNVPSFGKADATEDELRDFYGFWRRFSTWRDFSNAFEYDPETAENRWERRRMEQENESVRRSKAKAEVKRIADLVDLAYRYDPRVQAYKRAEAEAKAIAAAEAKAAQEESERLASEAAAAAAAAEAAAIREAEQKRQQQKVASQRLRKKLRSLADELTPDAPPAGPLRDLLLLVKADASVLVEPLAEASTADLKRWAMPAFGSRPQSLIAPLFALVSAAVAAREAEEARKAAELEALRIREEEQAAQRAAAEAAIKARVWTAAELTLLTQLLRKIPGTTPGRFQRIAEKLASELPPTCGQAWTDKECLVRSKGLTPQLIERLRQAEIKAAITEKTHNTAIAATLGAVDEFGWSAGEVKLLATFWGRYEELDLQERMEAVAKRIPTRSAEDIAERLRKVKAKKAAEKAAKKAAKK
jgi:DnaJ family protein C protein 2